MGDEKGAADFSLRIVWSLARWIEDTKGSAALARLASLASVRVTDFDGTTHWVSHAQMETILAEGRRLAGDEETFRRALVHRFEESYGAFRHMVWAVSPARMAHLSIAMSNKVLTHVSRFETLSSTRTSLGFRYTSARAESADMCLSRRMAWMHFPLIYGLPPAEVVERQCIARGDSCCEYQVSWSQAPKLASVAIGIAIGVVMALLARVVHAGPVTDVVWLLLGASAGYAFELRRMGRRHLDTALAAGAALRSLGEAEAETRSEIVALQQRQHAWSTRMEREATEREEMLERIVQGLDGLQKTRVTSIRGFSHDLRNPLFVVRANAHLLRERVTDPEDVEILDDMDTSIKQIEVMLGQLMDVATADTEVAKLAPEVVPVAPLVEALRRRLRALVHGRGIDVVVTVCDDAPESLLVDRLVFDRVVDNLMTNAAKYTDRGSIVLSLRGPRLDEPSNETGLVLELTDTGRGIAKAQLAEIFRPRAPGMPSEKDSYGVGLSSAVRLLGQIGGGLEVASEVGRGSTFQARFPARPPTQRRSITGEDVDRLIASVVTVRAAEEIPQNVTPVVRPAR